MILFEMSSGRGDLTDDDIAIIDHSLQGIKLRLKLEAKNKGVVTPP